MAKQAVQGQINKRFARQTLKGRVISNAMDKTAVVLVESLKAHPKYRKRYKVSKKYKAHDPKKLCQVGDVVEIVYGRPYSKEKRFRVRYEKKDKK